MLYIIDLIGYQCVNQGSAASGQTGQKASRFDSLLAVVHSVDHGLSYPPLSARF